MPLSELTVDLSKMCGPSRLGPPLDTPSTPPLDALDARTELGPRHPSMLPLMQPLDAPRCRPSSPSMSMVVEVTLDALDVDPRRPLDDPSMRPRYSTPPAQLQPTASSPFFAPGVKSVFFRAKSTWVERNRVPAAARPPNADFFAIWPWGAVMG